MSKINHEEEQHHFKGGQKVMVKLVTGEEFQATIIEVQKYTIVFDYGALKRICYKANIVYMEV